ncbi:MAG: hypothetical protein GY862_00390, partial [Gammaproteobacteria bacterium]|nr:hypothetical protein [Gammaproteobacteria bacterium]
MPKTVTAPSAKPVSREGIGDGAGVAKRAAVMNIAGDDTGIPVSDKPEAHPEQEGLSIPEKEGLPRVKREAGTGDTDTIAPNNRRYLRVKRLILNGKLSPSVYALCKYDGWGRGVKKLGKDTARAFLEAIAGEGAICTFLNGKGKRCFEL